MTTNRDKLNKINEEIKNKALEIYKNVGVGCTKNCIAYDVCINHSVHYRRCINTISRYLLQLEENSKIVEREVKKCLDRVNNTIRNSW